VKIIATKTEAELRDAELAGHVLTLLARNEADGLHVYRLAKPGDSNHANTLLFDRFGIVIHGDTCFGDHDCGMAVSGARGKGPGWFAGDLSADYLAGKFLRRNNWCAKRAAEALRADSGDLESIAIRAALLVVADDLEAGVIGSEFDLAQRLSEDGLTDCFEGVPGYGYDENALGWLVAIQKRFATLWAAP